MPEIRRLSSSIRRETSSSRGVCKLQALPGVSCIDDRLWGHSGVFKGWTRKSNVHVLKGWPAEPQNFQRRKKESHVNFHPGHLHRYGSAKFSGLSGFPDVRRAAMSDVSSNVSSFAARVCVNRVFCRGKRGIFRNISK